MGNSSQESPDGNHRMTQGSIMANQQHLPAAPPDHQAIAERAYTLFLESGSENGHCEENWCQAESQLRQAASTTPAEDVMESEGGGSVSHPTPPAAPRRSNIRPPFMAPGTPTRGGLTTHPHHTQRGNR